MNHTIGNEGLANAYFHIAPLTDAPPSSLMDSTYESKGEDNGRRRSWSAFLGLQHFEVEGHVGVLKWD
jgi:hypothetical protein